MSKKNKKIDVAFQTRLSRSKDTLKIVLKELQAVETKESTSDMQRLVALQRQSLTQLNSSYNTQIGQGLYSNGLFGRCI